MTPKAQADLELENLILRQRLGEAQELIGAIRSGSVDAFIADNDQVYTLQSADHVYRVLVDTMNQGAVTLGLDSSIMYVNREFSRLMGMSADTLIGQDFARLVCDGDEIAFLRALQRCQYEPSRVDLSIRTAEGRDVCVLISLSSLVPHGIQAVCALITDLTERKSNEETAVVRKRLELSQSAGRVGTFDWDLRTGAVVWTRDLEALFGLPAGGFDGTYQGWARRVHPEDLPGVEERVTAALKQEQPFHVEYRIIWPDGSLHWIEAKGTVEQDGNGEPVRFVGVNLDITERKELELRLARSNAELAEYAAVASHDLQAPLRTIASYLGVLEARYANLFDERALRYFTYITDSTKLMDRLIRGILDYSQAGGEDAPLDTVDSGEAVRAALANLDESIKKREAQITVGELPTVRANRVDLIRLFQNLMGNAVKFCERRPAITIAAVRNEHEWVFSVSDNGPGIEQGSYERIFKLFQRLTSEAQVPGSGIGLATCKKIVERHGGRIWVESTVGTGSTFVFTIPC